MTYSVTYLYRFTPIDNIPALRDEIRAFCQTHDIFGTILLAPEGINGTIAGSAENIEATIDFLVRASPTAILISGSSALA